MFNNNLNICLFPFEIEWGNIKGNIERLEKSLDVIHPHTDLIVMPECFITGFPSHLSRENIIEILDVDFDPLQRLKQIAFKYNTAIAGSIIVEENSKLYNKAIFIEPTGDIYSEGKKHLFTMAGENEIFVNGKGRMKLRYRGWNISMVVCYDLRFPVWCRNKNNEYDLLIVVANWPEARIDAWNKLLPARAIENQSYVAGVNCKGKDPHDIIYDGSSTVYSFIGKDIGVKVGNFIYASLSHERLSRFREKFPAWKDADSFNIL